MTIINMGLSCLNPYSINTSSRNVPKISRHLEDIFWTFVLYERYRDLTDSSKLCIMRAIKLKNWAKRLITPEDYRETIVLRF